MVELLVVIAIIIILSLLAMTGFRAVQDRASRMKDASNLRQIGLAIHQYAAENNNTLPGPAWVSLTTDVRVFLSMGGYDQLGVYLAPYLLGRAVKPGDPPIPCPVFVSPMFKAKPGEPPPTAHYIRTTHNVFPFGDQAGANRSPPKKLVALPGLYGKELSKIWSVRFNVHTLQNGRNYLFFDGHVEWFPSGTGP